MTDWRLIDRWLAGEADAEERVRVDAWLREDPRNAELLSVLRDPRLFAGGFAGVDVEAAWQEQRRRSGLDASNVRAAAGSGRRVWLAAAAMAALLVTAAAIATMLVSSAPAQQSIVSGLVPDTIALPDGSTVILGAGSRLAWSERFAGDARTVTLAGEAHFDVVAVPAARFIVEAAPARVAVLGTRFVVRAWPADSLAEIVVEEGSVRVQAGAAAGEAADLGPAQAATIAAGRLTVRTGADLRAALSWIDGGLGFDDVPLALALPRMERRFDVRFRTADAALLQRRITASFDSPTLELVLEAFALALNLSFERDGDIISVAAR